MTFALVVIILSTLYRHIADYIKDLHTLGSCIVTVIGLCVAPSWGLRRALHDLNARIDALSRRLVDLEARLNGLSTAHRSSGASDPRLRHRVRELERSAGFFKLRGGCNARRNAPSARQTAARVESDRDGRLKRGWRTIATDSSSQASKMDKAGDGKKGGGQGQGNTMPRSSALRFFDKMVYPAHDAPMNRNNAVMGSSEVRSAPPGWFQASGQPLDWGAPQKVGQAVSCPMCGKSVTLRELPQGFGFGDRLVGYSRHKSLTKPSAT